jgi:hypothetical protein
MDLSPAKSDRTVKLITIFSAEFKNVWSFTSIPYAFTA